MRGDHAKLRELGSRRLGDHLVGRASRLVLADSLGGKLVFEKVPQTRCLQRSLPGDGWRVGKGDQAIACCLQFPKAVGNIRVRRQGGQASAEFADIRIAD